MSENSAAAAPLAGRLVISLEQAVAAPYCSRLLAEAGARVIKLERPEGDFARAYDSHTAGQSTYFVWLNAGKESLVVDLRTDEDRALLTRLLARADVFVQNLRHGAIERLGFGWPVLQSINPGLIMCNITGFGTADPALAGKKAYDALIQAETGLCSVTGKDGAPSKVGISVCDISTGLTAYSEILKALIARERTGAGQRLDCSLFGTIAEWMAVPLTTYEQTGSIPAGRGMDHGQIAPYGAFRAADGLVFMAIQNNAEWQQLCRDVLDDPALAQDARFRDNMSRLANLAELKDLLEAHFADYRCADLFARFEAAGIAHGRINDVSGLSSHSALSRKTVQVGDAQIDIVRHEGDRQTMPRAVPSLDEHGASVRAEFAGTDAAVTDSVGADGAGADGTASMARTG